MGAVRRKLRQHLTRISRRLFLAGDRVGIHAMPAHYYSPVASRRWMRRNETRWRRPASLRGIEWDLDLQAAWVADVSRYVAEIPLRVVHERSEPVGGFRYGPIEAQMLYCFVRHQAPGRIVEIGSGSTTMLMAEAAGRNAAEDRERARIMAIDPYAHPGLLGLPGVEVRRTDALDLEPDDLGLGANDLLFIDSTHAVKTGSEVPHLYLDLIPALPPDVWIHVHDIYLPYLYSSQVYERFFDWQETTLVAALLTGNPGLEVKACLSALHHERPAALRSAFPDYRPRPMSRGIDMSPGGDFPASLWLQTAPVDR